MRRDRIAVFGDLVSRGSALCVTSAVISLLAAAACNSPRDACLDYAGTVTGKINQCFGTSLTAAEFTFRVQGQGLGFTCAEASTISDPIALYDYCIPRVASLDCSELGEGDVETIDDTFQQCNNLFEFVFQNRLPTIGSNVGDDDLVPIEDAGVP